MTANSPDTFVVLCVHSPMHKAFLEVLEHIGQNNTKFLGYDIVADVEPEKIANQIFEEILGTIEEKQSVLVLTDLIGATPYNISKSVLEKLQKKGVQSDLISGINMGILLTALRSHSLPFEELKQKIIISGRKCMKLDSELNDKAES